MGILLADISHKAGVHVLVYSSLPNVQTLSNGKYVSCLSLVLTASCLEVLHAVMFTAQLSEMTRIVVKIQPHHGSAVLQQHNGQQS